MATTNDQRHSSGTCSACPTTSVVPDYRQDANEPGIPSRRHIRPQQVESATTTTKHLRPVGNTTSYIRWYPSNETTVPTAAHPIAAESNKQSTAPEAVPTETIQKHDMRWADTLCAPGVEAIRAGTGARARRHFHRPHYEYKAISENDVNTQCMARVEVDKNTTVKSLADVYQPTIVL